MLKYEDFSFEQIRKMLINADLKKHTNDIKKKIVLGGNHAVNRGVCV